MYTRVGTAPGRIGTASGIGNAPGHSISDSCVGGGGGARARGLAGCSHWQREGGGVYLPTAKYEGMTADLVKLREVEAMLQASSSPPARHIASSLLT